MRFVLLVAGIAASFAATAADITGSYTVEGRNASGKPYGGTLEVSHQGGLYRFDWNTGAPSGGVAVVDGNTVTVAYGGRHCGVVSYEVRSDGSLDGVWAQSGDQRAGSELATVLARSPNGTTDYSVDGKGPNGEPYRGSLRVVPQGDRLTFSWRTGNESEGFGIDRDRNLAVVYGGPDCGVATYSIAGDGVLDGVWAKGNTGIGRESATRRAGR